MLAHASLSRSTKQLWRRSGTDCYRQNKWRLLIAALCLLVVILVILLFTQVHSLDDVTLVTGRRASKHRPSSTSIIEQWSLLVDESKPLPPYVKVSVLATEPAPVRTAPQPSDTALWADRAALIKQSFLHAYQPYAKHCWGRDQYQPLSQTCSDWLQMSATLIDSMSTMWLMSLHEEFEAGLMHVRSLDFSVPNSSNSFFEITIRILGSLLSCYDLSGQKHDILLSKAQELADRLMPAFRSGSGLPLTSINLHTGSTSIASWTGNSLLLAEVASCQMEFFALTRRLQERQAKLLGASIDNEIEAQYRVAAQKPIDILDRSSPKIPGLYPAFIDPSSGAFTRDEVRVGAWGDSCYEYLLKTYLLAGKPEQYLRMYRQSMSSIIKHLYQHTPSGVAYLADFNSGAIDPKMDHLVCFFPGMLALGVLHQVVSGEEAQLHMKIARELTETCVRMYDSNQPSHVAAEYSRFSPEMTPGHDRSYQLRPEAIESVFILWRVTKDIKYREEGWKIWTAIDQACRVPTGYAALLDVLDTSKKQDKMESFFLAETLKYFFLLFSDDELLPLAPRVDADGQLSSYYVLNTEAQPILAW